MIKFYHKISNKILLYRYDKRLWKLPFYYFFVATDFILYVYSPLKFNLSRTKACGKTFVISNFNGVYITDFDNLQDYINRTQSGMEKKCPMLLAPLKETYEYPLIEPSIVLDKQKHIDYRKSLIHINFVRGTETISNDTSRFIEECITDNTFTLSVSNVFIRKLIYKQFGIEVSNEVLISNNKPLSMFFTMLLATVIPQKYVISDNRTRAMDTLVNQFSEKFPELSSRNIMLQISSIENGTNVLVLVLHSIMKHIDQNNLWDIIAQDLLLGNDDLLTRCIFEGSRFAKYHGGSTAVETLETERRIMVGGSNIILQPGDSIIRNIIACLYDPKYFPSNFYPYHSNIDLIKATTFNGFLVKDDKIDQNVHNRSCQFQIFGPKLLAEIIKQLLLNYTWDNMKINSFETPFTPILLQNIHRK